MQLLLSNCIFHFDIELINCWLNSGIFSLFIFDDSLSQSTFTHCWNFAHQILVFWHCYHFKAPSLNFELYLRLHNLSRVVHHLIFNLHVCSCLLFKTNFEDETYILLSKMCSVLLSLNPDFRL